jgi:Mrp family chromosome partitioning ATPase
MKEGASGVSFVVGGEESAVATDALLMSSRFAALMQFARETYQVVVIDTPPVGLVVDAAIVARYCNAGLFVVRYASTAQRMAVSSIRELVSRVDIPIYGILNDVAAADSYQYGYGRRRGYFG